MDSLFAVQVTRKNQTGAITLNFKTEEAANHVFAKLHTGLTKREIISDQFGAKVSFDPEDIGNVLLADMRLNGEPQIFHTIMNQRIQAKIAQACKSDPLINGSFSAGASKLSLPQH